MRSEKAFLYKGITLIGSFLGILLLLFFPLYDGHNALEFLDNLYNSISKGSANYLSVIKEEIVQFKSREIDVSISMEDKMQASQTARLIEAAGGRAHPEEKSLKIEGDLAGLLLHVLEDAREMYYNRGKEVRDKYGYNERRVLFNWWSALKFLDVELSKQKLFKEAKLVALVKNKAVETAYNYYGIEAQSIGERYGIVLVSLLFYVFYTLWYGFGVMYLFEGLGLNL